MCSSRPGSCHPVYRRSSGHNLGYHTPLMLLNNILSLRICFSLHYDSSMISCPTSMTAAFQNTRNILKILKIMKKSGKPFKVSHLFIPILLIQSFFPMVDMAPSLLLLISAFFWMPEHLSHLHIYLMHRPVF